MQSLISISPSPFDSPELLLLLLLLPIFPAIGLRSIAGLGSTRFLVATVVRSALFSLIVLALARPNFTRHSDAQTAIFVIDRSLSVSAANQQLSLDFVREAAREVRPGTDKLAIISFARDRSIDQTASESLWGNAAHQSLQVDRTDLASALRLAAVLAPPDSSSRIVVLSDGNENMGQALNEAAFSSASSIPIDVAPLSYTISQDVMVERLECPQTATTEEPVPLEVVFRAQAPSTGHLRFYHNDRAVNFGDVSQIPITLQGGVNRYKLSYPLSTAGFHRFAVEYIATDLSQDSIAANNHARAFTIVGGRDKTLILSQSDLGAVTRVEENARILSEALSAQGIESEVHTVPGTPIDIGMLMNYSAVILTNVPASALEVQEQRALATYVHEMGGGLIVLGGDQSFCMGGYGDTPLEAVLPVETNRARLNLLRLSLILIIDRSGSMSGEKLQLAKKAAAGSAQLLSRLDRIGVIAFDGFPEWVVPFQQCLAKDNVLNAISTIGAGGGTNLHPAMAEAYRVLRGQANDKAHVIILTDGHSMPGDFLGLAKKMSDAGATISTIGVGAEADKELLRKIASATGGRFYFAQSPQSVPRVFARETVLANRSGMVEARFRPLVRGNPSEPILAGFSQEAFPPLGGYVISVVKGPADVSLVCEREGNTDPILAHWRVGLGKTVAFTSGMWTQWGNEWASWSQFSKFWTQLVRWTARSSQNDDVTLTAEVDGARARLKLEATSEGSLRAAAMQVSASVVGPDFKAVPLKLQQTSLGLFEAEFEAADAGDYMITTAYQVGASGALRKGIAHTGFSVPSSPEFRDLKSNEWLLEELARRSGGRILSMADAFRVFKPEPLPVLKTRRPLAEILLKIACFLVLLDVAVRRLSLDPAGTLLQLRKWVGVMVGSSVASASVETLQSLKDVRRRTSDALPTRSNSVSSKFDDAHWPVQHAEPHISPQSNPHSAGAGPTAPPPTASADQLRATREDSPDDTTHTGRLLRARRKAGDADRHGRQNP